MAVHDRQDTVDQLKIERKKPKALMAQLRKEKKAADAEVKSIGEQLVAIGEWTIMLDALHAAVQSDSMSIAALLAMREPLLRLAVGVTHGVMKPQVDDLINLAVSFVGNSDDKHALGKLLHALTPKGL
ncbi:hypothetical protein AMAG_10602 [Allomyces macrogynus ATCC 38327]|uniref:Uncharacterized protein n=1 Tax=Allomyces macrogynus (strain ATCC 38327) TaxID=578462 RepID=A0A0L0SR00_ALLM3|nr:hypothetical protein AMAG_10602 [Allomyces macrogynus ATCC 38327]|eukprot:KNE64937.1 hypothetical protein AMAG_10602 [Allomyces macrogynus ATCC 38327]